MGREEIVLAREFNERLAAGGQVTDLIAADVEGVRPRHPGRGRLREARRLDRWVGDWSEPWDAWRMTVEGYAYAGGREEGLAQVGLRPDTPPEERADLRLEYGDLDTAAEQRQ